MFNCDYKSRWIFLSGYPTIIAQSSMYCMYFDFTYIVCTANHFEHQYFEPFKRDQ